ncbi:hypothetical protein COP2_001191 [Malus domestica]
MVLLHGRWLFRKFMEDVVLKDKIIVYDLARRRLGWADCSLPMNINVTFGNDKGKSSSRDLPIMLLIGTLLMHLFLYNIKLKL